MFKEENRIWWYLIGIVILILLLIIVAKDYIIPVVMLQKPIIITQPFTYDAPQQVANRNLNYRAVFNTSKGTFVVDLYERAAPQNVNSFVFLANQGYYNGTSFYRVVNDFLVQAGDRNTLDEDPGNDGKGNPGYLIEDEINWDSLDFNEAKRNELNSRGYRPKSGLESRPLERFSMAMANTAPNTNGSQFFFVTADNDDPRINQLNGYFTVVGKVVSGGDVVLDIGDTPTQVDGSGISRPQEKIVINSIRISTI